MLRSEDYLREHIAQVRDMWLEKQPQSAPEYKFSRRFEWKMNKLLKKGRAPQYAIDRYGNYAGNRLLKRRLWQLVALIAAMLFLLSAWAAIPHISFADGHISIRLYGAQNENGQFVLYADYHSFDEDFEIVQDIEVSTDPYFWDVLRLETCVAEPHRPYEYTFYTEEDIYARLYIRPPVLSVADQIEQIDLPLALGNTAMLADGTEWFTVSQIEWTETEGLHIRLKAKEGTLWPKYPRVEVDGQFYFCSTEHTLDEKGYFTDCDLLIRDIAAEDVEKVVLHFEDVRRRVTPDKEVFKSDQIEIIIRDGGTQ